MIIVKFVGRVFQDFVVFEILWLLTEILWILDCED